MPVFVDSGGFTARFPSAHICETNHHLGVIEWEKDGRKETIHPHAVLAIQEKIADIAFTLDFPIPPATEKQEAIRRQTLTINNAYWALNNRRAKNLLLYACVQAWDVESAKECARAYKGFDGIALGGLASRGRDVPAVLAMVEAVRAEIGELPLHVFGLGHPAIVEKVFQAGGDSISSSSYVKLALEGRFWGYPERTLDPPFMTERERVDLAICNVACAPQRPLPLSCSRMVFRTAALFLATSTKPQEAEVER